MPARARTLAWAVALITIAAGPALAARDDGRLDALSTRYLEHWLERHPAEATALGAHRDDDVLRPISESSLRDDQDWTRALRDEVEAIPGSGLTDERRIDRAVLLAQLERDQLQLDQLRPWTRDPAAFLPLLDGAIRVLVDQTRRPDCDRARPLTRRLRQIPEAVRAAIILLAHPDPDAVAAAIPRLEAVLRLYRGGVGRAIADCRDGTQQADLAEADTSAVRAVEDLLATLRQDSPPGTTRSATPARAVLERWLASEGVAQAPVESVITRGEREIDAAAAAQPEIARAAGVSFPSDSATVLDHMEGAFEPLRRALGVTLTMPRASRFRLGARSTRDDERPRLVVRLFDSGPWTGASRWWLAAVTDRLGSTRDDEITRAMVDPLIASAQASAARAQRSSLRQALSWPATELGVREGLAVDDSLRSLTPSAVPPPEQRAAGVAMTVGLLRAWLAAANSDGESAATDGAPREVRSGPLPGDDRLDAVQALATLGRWQFEDLRAQVRSALGARFDARGFHDAVLAAGNAPWPIVRTIVLEQFGITEPR